MSAGRNAALLLDTNAILWFAFEPHRLGKNTRTLLTDARSRGGLFVSVATIWELAILIRRRRLDLGVPLSRWVRDAEAAGYSFLPIDAPIVLEAYSLPDFHPDPADRFLVDTARLKRLAPVTADRAILAWGNALDRLDARA